MHVTRGPRWRGLTLFAPALVAGIAALTMSPAQATPNGHAGRGAPAAYGAQTAQRGHGSPQTRPHAASAFGGTASLNGVSCRNATWCMAVGTYTTTDHVMHSLAMIWNGTAWRTLPNPPGGLMRSVSCSSQTFCMASGGPTGAERWNGTSWQTMLSPKGGVFGVSCGSQTLCMMIYGGVVRSWNGTSWHLQSQTNFCGGGPPGPCGLASVSCGNATNCLGVGTVTIDQAGDQESIGMFWNGKTWARTEPPLDGNPAAANTVSCAGEFCMEAGGAFSEVAGGGIAVAGAWNATARTWTDVSPNLGTLCTGPLALCYWASAMACASKANCMSLGGPDGIQHWNGSTWHSDKAVSAGTGSGLTAMSCGGNDCLAVGFRTVSGKRRTLAELWNGSAWSIITTPK